LARSAIAVGDCFDNAITEGFFATLECELLDRRYFTSRAQAKAACFDFIEGFYNVENTRPSACSAPPSTSNATNPSRATVSLLDHKTRPVYRTGSISRLRTNAVLGLHRFT
jgi:hypothetical protein